MKKIFKIKKGKVPKLNSNIAFGMSSPDLLVVRNAVKVTMEDPYYKSIGWKVKGIYKGKSEIDRSWRKPYYNLILKKIRRS